MGALADQHQPLPGRVLQQREQGLGHVRLGLLVPLGEGQGGRRRDPGRVVEGLAREPEVEDVVQHAVRRPQDGRGLAAPTGSLASVALHHASNQPGGISDAFLSSGTPRSHRSSAAWRRTVRYAPNFGTLWTTGAPTQMGAYRPSRCTVPGFWAA